ncbi:protein STRICTOSIDINE SYNTHASE-LIKE 2-like isoform X2 [Rutidosis leptorrhynchoides]|uniref:protein STRICTOSIDINE SYNTHASE-LIKE 2-like isoform X2 n=1 Tax=Rutidosis leptorrhynchoides TaxID=125765 RepID=UPI003A9A34F0
MFYSKLLVTTLTILMLIVSMLLCCGFTFNNRVNDNDDAEVIQIDGGAVGPESFDFDHGDGLSPYTGVSDGRIVKWIASERRWIDFAVTSNKRDGCGGPEMEHICGRPLGLKLDKSRGDLYIADAYFGLLVVGPKGGLATSLVSQVLGLPLMFTNSLEIDHENGLVYFTDSSQRYTRRDHTLAVLTDDQTGRLLKYNLETKEVNVLLYNLTFPNGVILSQDGYPDNIKRNKNGEFWVAMFSRKRTFLKLIHYIPWIVEGLIKLPIDVVKVSSYIAKVGGEGLAAKLGVDGEILKILEDTNGKIWKYASEVMEIDEHLWIGSVENPFVVKLKMQAQM